MKYSRIQLTHKKKKTLVKVFYSQTEVTMAGDNHENEYTKKTDQFMSKALQHCVDVMKPHIMFGGEYAGDKINLNAELDYPKWFSSHEWEDDERFHGVEITEIQFIGNDVLDSVKLKGYRTTQKTEKEFKAPLETGVINLDRSSEYAYALVTLLDEHANNLLIELDEYVKGKTLTTSEQASLFDIQEKAEA